MVQFSDTILDRYGGYNLSKLTECGATQLPEFANLLDAAIWNHIFGLVNPDPSVVHLEVTFLRRALSASAEYELARRSLRQYVEALAKQRHELTSYWSALRHFEQCIAAVWQAAELHNKLEKKILKVKSEQLSVFQSGQNTDLERIHRIHVVSKHFNADQAGQLSSPVWISNDGIDSQISSLSFDELRENVIAVFEVARQIFVEVPREAVARSRQKTPIE